MSKASKVHDAIIVGGGIAGLTSAAYLAKLGYKPLLLEQQHTLGGLIHSFEYKGFTFDGGIRSIESLGVLKPMMKDLGISLELMRSHVTLGIEKKVIRLSSPSDIKSYEELLVSIFPEDEADIIRIFHKINRILKYMNVLYGIDNPMMMDLRENKSYVMKTLVPWLFKFVPTLYQIERLTIPVETYLMRLTKNRSLIDMIAQHFFHHTPAFFALGYFTIYFDYHYPIGGTGMLPESLVQYIVKQGGSIKTNTRIERVHLNHNEVIDTNGNSYSYRKLIWAADLKSLYHMIDINHVKSSKLKKQIHNRIEDFKDKRGAESVLTVYALVDLDPSYFNDRSSEHFFYTSQSKGLNHLKLPKTETMDELIPTLNEYLNLNTYEISIPVLRDATLAPKNQTGLILSILLDYEIVSHIEKKNYYAVFKSYVEKEVIEILSNSIYPDLKKHLIETFSSTPLTFEKRTSNSDGAIIGWSYTNQPIPVGHQMSQIRKSIRTGLPDVYQAGQWSFSPAGVPISIITGKLAADATKKHLKNMK